MTQFKLNFSVRGHRKTALLAFTGALAVMTVACSSDTESPTVTPAARISPVPPTVVVAPTAITPAAPPTDLADSVASPTPAGAETPTVEATPMAQGASTAPTATPAPTATAAPDPAEFVIIAKQPRVEPPPPSQPTGPPPVLDRTRASVSIDRIVFDTFGGSSVRLSDATFEMIERLRDVIRPIYEPSYEDVDGGGWLKDRDLVLGYVGVDAQYAYPIKMLNFHELVNDVIDGIPVLVTYCPLCGSGIVFDRQLGGADVE